MTLETNKLFSQTRGKGSVLIEKEFFDSNVEEVTLRIKTNNNLSTPKRSQYSKGTRYSSGCQTQVTDFMATKWRKPLISKPGVDVIPAGCPRVELPSLEARAVFLPCSLASTPQSFLTLDRERCPFPVEGSCCKKYTSICHPLMLS